MAETTESAATRFERAVLPHLDAAYTLARYLTRDASDAEDAVQETVLRAMRYLHTLRSDSDARAWFLAIVRRECYGIRGSTQSRMETVAYDDAPSLQLADPSESPEHGAHRQLVRERVRAAIDALSDHLRETLILREVQQCSYEEISVITDVPIGTVMSRLARARARLADLLRGVVDAGDLS